MMKRKWMNKWMVVLVLLVTAASCFAQRSFDYKAKLDEVKKDGFYKIMLSPSIVSKCNDNLTDLRIFDNKQSQVPYIVKVDSAQFVETSFIEFPIISRKKEKDKQTHITIENKTGKAIDHLLLIVANMQAYREINISGSNDMMEWSIIKERTVLESFFNTNKEETVLSISLPLVNYKYLQVTYLGDNILPANIVKAGIYKQAYSQGRYVEVPAPTVVQKDSNNKTSIIYVTFNEPYAVDRIDFDIEGPKYYQRTILMYSNDRVNTFPYSSSIGPNNSTLFFGGLKERKIRFVVYNNDNMPLTFKSAKAYQLNGYMLAYLEKDKQYHLAFGDSLTNAPEYDLKFFKDSIGVDIPVLGVGEIVPANTVKQPIVNPKNNNKLFLWITIAIVSILLLFFTLKMTREIKKRNNHADL